VWAVLVSEINRRKRRTEHRTWLRPRRCKCVKTFLAIGEERSANVAPSHDTSHGPRREIRHRISGERSGKFSRISGVARSTRTILPHPLELPQNKFTASRRTSSRGDLRSFEINPPMEFRDSMRLAGPSDSRKTDSFVGAGGQRQLRTAARDADCGSTPNDQTVRSRQCN